MRHVSSVLVLILAGVVGACAADAADPDLTAGTSPTDPTESSGGGPTGQPAGEPEEEGGIVADLRADTNRDGRVSFDGKADDDVHFAEDWDTYHAQLGEVHCGTNSTRQIPQAKWWESGR